MKTHLELHRHSMLDTSWRRYGTALASHDHGSWQSRGRVATVCQKSLVGWREGCGDAEADHQLTSDRRHLVRTPLRELKVRGDLIIWIITKIVDFLAISQ